MAKFKRKFYRNSELRANSVLASFSPKLKEVMKTLPKNRLSPSFRQSGMSMMLKVSSSK